MSESLESKMNGFIWRIEQLQNDLQEIIDDYNKVQNEECEEAFATFIQNGFTVGTKFRVEDKGPVWTIKGINLYGYVVESGSGEKHRKTTLDVRRKEQVEKFIKKLRIVRDDESEAVHE